jgi:serine/threonine protein phosphatase PrpC
MASDGVWEFISSETLVSIVAPFYESNEINGTCETIMKEALCQWT